MNFINNIININRYLNQSTLDKNIYELNNWLLYINLTDKLKKLLTFSFTDQKIISMLINIIIIITILNVIVITIFIVIFIFIVVVIIIIIIIILLLLLLLLLIFLLL